MFVPIRVPRVSAAAALGALTPLGFAPHGWYALPAVTLAGLLLLVDGQRAPRAFLLGWVFGLAQFGVGVHWLYIALHTFGEAPIWLGILLTGAMCCTLALYPAAVVALAVRHGWLRAHIGWVAVPALWLFAELLRRTLFWGGFPWFSLGYSQTDSPLRALAPLLGVYGISAVVVWVAYALFRLAVARTRGAVMVALPALLAPAVCLLLPAPESWTRVDGEPVATAIIQGDLSIDQKYAQGMQQRVVNNFQTLTMQNLDRRLIVWPEAALPMTLQDAQPFIANLRDVLRAHNTALLFGAVNEQPGPDSHPRYFNSAIADGAAVGRYDKRHLVPFGEFFPIPDFLRPLMMVLGTPYDDIMRGAREQAPLTLAGNKVDVSICYEDVYGSEFRHDARDAGFLINITDDAWYGRSDAAVQHLQIARMRALEYGREIVRATATGVSAFIGADGQARQQTPLFEVLAIRDDVQPRTGVTPYVRWGDAPLWWLSGLISAGALYLTRRRKS